MLAMAETGDTGLVMVSVGEPLMSLAAETDGWTGGL